MEWDEFGAKSLSFIDTPIAEDARITVLDGSVRSSKTVTLMPKLFEYCRRGPAGTLAMTGVSKQTVKRNVLNDIFDTAGTRNYRYNSTTGELRLFGRNIQVIGVKDEGSEKYIRGGTYAGWFGDEVTTMPQSSFTQLLNRMSVEGAKAYLTTNPDSPYHYLYTDYITNNDLVSRGMVRRIHFELDDNPSLSAEYKDFIRSAYSGLWYKRMIQGLWVLAEGAIYDMYDPARHEIDVARLPQRFDKRIVGIDFGAGNPTAFIKIGVTFRSSDRKPVFWEYGEYYHDPRTQGNKTNAQYKRDFVEFIGGRYQGERLITDGIEPIDLIIPDPSAASFIIELQSNSCGIAFKQVLPGDNDVLAGINSVSTPMQDGRYFVVRDRCPNSCKETASYIWDAKKQKLGEDAPVKEHDHCKDAERYAIHTTYPASNLERLYASCR